MNFLKHLVAYLRFLASRFAQDRCLMVAGSLTYTSLLALVPLVTVTVILTSRVPFVRELILRVKWFALKNLVPEMAGKVVSTYVEQFVQNAAQLTALGLVIVVGSAVALIFTIDGVFNDIWRARGRRSMWKRLAAYLALLALGPLLMGASLTLTSYVVHWTRGIDAVIPFLDEWLLKLVPFLLTTAALVIAYRVMPARHVPFRHAFAGGVTAGLLFEIGKHLFVVYVMRVPTYSLVYGAFASVPIFLVWIFCCWVIVLLGAEIAATMSHFRVGTRPVSQRPPLPIGEALRIIDALGQGAFLSLDHIRRRVTIPIDTSEDILHALETGGLVRTDWRGRYSLERPHETIGRADVVQAMNAAA